MLRKIYPYYALFIFLSSFLLLFPLMFLFIHFKGAKSINHWLYRIWGYVTLGGCFIKRKNIRHFKTKKGQVYIYCANHTSYLDIPALYCSIHQDLSFIGKKSLGKVPLFGYIYSRLHILVDRRDKESKKETVERSKEAIDKGINLIIFPEGTIPKHHNPHLIEFKDGAFKIAIEKQIPIVPVTMPYNFKILPDQHKMKAFPHECRVIFHEPIETKGMSLENASELKDKVYNIIHSELKKYSVI